MKSYRRHKKLPVGALAHLQWLDADADNSWTTVADTLSREPTIVETVGWIIGHADPYLVVAADRDGDYINSVTRIPYSWIRNVRILETENKETRQG